MVSPTMGCPWKAPEWRELSAIFSRGRADRLQRSCSAAGQRTTTDPGGAGWLPTIEGGVEMSSQPHIVLVHGAWADGSCWSSVIEQLQTAGYRVTAPQFPLTSLA